MCISTQAAMQRMPTNELLFEIQIVVCSNNLRVILSRDAQEKILLAKTYPRLNFFLFFLIR